MSIHQNYALKVSLPNKDAAGLSQNVTTIEHNFLESGLFTDEKIAKLIENYPREHYLFSTMTQQGTTPEWFHGELTGMDGKFILEAIKKGRLWLSLRRFDLNAPEYYEIADQGLTQLSEMNPALKYTRHTPSLLISSPQARVLYHADIAMVALWHLRGQKRVWLYDADNKEQLPEKSLEGIVLGETEEEIFYDEKWDETAQNITLEPGHAVTWPHNAPHRIDNLEGLNVSISSEFQTIASRKSLGVRYANGLLRRKFKKTPKSTKSEGAIALAKCAAALALKKSGIFAMKDPDRKVSFRLDPDNVGEIIKIPAHEQKNFVQR